MSTLTTPQLEQVYDLLAESIDRAPVERRELFLVKLALLLAHRLGDPAVMAEQVEIALRDL